MLFQASLPTHYWVESLYAANYLLNLLPTKAISAPIPHFALFSTTPSYVHLRVFGCACYPNTSATAPHKLAPCSCRCVFLGYSSDYNGYRCLDLTTNRMLIFRHIVFNESSFPFASSGPPTDDLDSLFSSSLLVHAIAPPYPSSVADTLETAAMPHTTPVPQLVPCTAPAPQPTPRAAPTSTTVPRAASMSPSSSSSAPRTASASRFAPPCVPVMTSGSHVGSSVYHPVTVARDPHSTHPMVTRRAARVTKPVDRLQLSAVAAPPTLFSVPTSVRSVLADPH
jgi:hypothetical protein